MEAGSLKQKRLIVFFVTDYQAVLSKLFRTSKNTIYFISINTSFIG